MFWILLCFLILICVVLGVLKVKKNNIFESKEGNQIKILNSIIGINIFITVLLFFILPFKYGINIWGLVIFILINIIFLFLVNGNLVKNYIIFSIFLVLYLAIMFLVPVYENEGYELGYYANSYYNCYNIRIYRHIDFSKSSDGLSGGLK